MQRELEFTVEEIFFLSRLVGVVVIAGRCCKQTIRVGDHFTRVFDYGLSEGFSGEREEHDEEPINLWVRSIEMYQTEFEKCGPGEVAAIKLTGSGVSSIRKNAMIAGISPS